MKLDPIPESWRQEYLKRPASKLPGDLVRACDQIRAQGREINSLRAQIFRYKLKNFVLVGIVGGAAAEGVKVAVMALFKLLGH